MPRSDRHRSTTDGLLSLALGLSLCSLIGGCRTTRWTIEPLLIRPIISERSAANSQIESQYDACATLLTPYGHSLQSPLTEVARRLGSSATVSHLEFGIEFPRPLEACAYVEIKYSENRQP